MYYVIDNFEEKTPSEIQIETVRLLPLLSEENIAIALSYERVNIYCSRINSPA